MGRFPWSYGHSKQGSDKLHTVTHEWFSKENAEPSREALADLMKDYSTLEPGQSDISPKARSRSRTNTMNSSFSVYDRSLSDDSMDLASRPPSQQSFVDTGMPLLDRHESTAKFLLAKGTRILKRQGSKLNLLPSHLEDRSTSSPEVRIGELSPAQFGLQRQATLTSRRKLASSPICPPELIVFRNRFEAKHIRTFCLPALDSW